MVVTGERSFLEIRQSYIEVVLNVNHNSNSETFVAHPGASQSYQPLSLGLRGYSSGVP
jgi:hypothetical protein